MKTSKKEQELSVIKKLDLERNVHEILEHLICSVHEFYQNDESLLTDGEQRRSGMEQACAFRIGFYLCNLIKDTKIKSYNVDMEYNKNGIRQKFIKVEQKTRPDLIVHERWKNTRNLLIVEFKDVESNHVCSDIEKLKFFTNPSEEYKYKIGVLVELGYKEDDVNYRYFQKGKEIHS
jgi:hypothetical protein